MTKLEIFWTSMSASARLQMSRTRSLAWPSQAIDETLRTCIAENVLAPFLASQQKEKVLEIMVTLFAQKKIAETHDYNVKKVARQEDRQLGREEGTRAMASAFRNMSVEQKQIAQRLVEQFNLLTRTAEEKAKQYWKK